MIELLVVIGVISLLAALTFPVLGAVKRAQVIHRARAELTQIETAIEAYKTKLGFYPPDNAYPPRNPRFWTPNQLYYELLGTSRSGTLYRTLDGSAQIDDGAFSSAFGAGTKVTGFMNCTKPGAGDDAPVAVKFLAGLKSAQFLTVNACTLLGVSVNGAAALPRPEGGQFTPYCYNSSNPQHNPKSFDLWVDVLAGGKTNRISNWSSRPIIVSTTAYP